MLPFPPPQPRRPASLALRPSCRPERVRGWLASGCFLVALLALLGIPGPGRAVLISTGEGSENTAPPSADPGFANVGVLNGLSGVYVRNGWVITASHVGEGAISLAGILYQPIDGSGVTMRNADGSLTDLLVFKLAERPDLPDLLLTNSAPTLNSLLTIVGRGRNRGEATSWMGHVGWAWGAGSAIRWGTNRIGEVGRVSVGTQSFWIYFDDLPGNPSGQSEADLVTGDSGGAAFTGSGASAELIGILIARATYEDQPANTSLYGNAGVIADLFPYRNDLLEVIDQPDCADGLDDDGDGLADYPADPGCTSPSDTRERDDRLICDNGLDDDSDGLIDQNDPGCLSADDTSERGASYGCDNGLDDDNDELFDFPDDTGCLHPTNLVEAPEPKAGWMLASGILGLALLAHRLRLPRIR
jgi:hypothetical protein